MPQLGFAAKENADGANVAPSNVTDRLREVEQQLEKARREEGALAEREAKLDRELGDLKQTMVTAARKILDHERAVIRLEDRLGQLDEAEAEKLVTLDLAGDQYKVVLGALARIARFPPEALMAQPMPPGDMVRSAILLRAAVPGIDAQAERLRGDLLSIAETREEIAKRKTELASATTALQGERDRLDKLLDRKADLYRQTQSQRQTLASRAAQLAAESQTLQELFNRIEEDRIRRDAERQAAEAKAEAAARTALARDMAAQARRDKPAPPENERAAAAPPPGKPQTLTVTAMRPAPPAPRAKALPISRARGQLPFPAEGRIVARYGQVLSTGLTHKGISLETRANAQVVAPYDGEVVYAGEFRGYGQLLIIDHGEGYHTLLAGLGRIDGVIGQWVLAGEPVGVMNAGGSSLYVELRRNGQPINPLPWLADTKDKASG